ncbi:MAG: DUF547 domain-containing protein [Alphaproteobacteria bacterium]|nr:DUF547 domain-containing protein [Alphaproteobacteria bacterium]
MKIRLITFLTLLLGLFLTGTAPALASDDYLTPYDGLLAQYVKPGNKDGINAALVDYRGWARDPRHLQAMVSLQKANPETLISREEKAFWINAYNLLTIDLIIHHPDIASIKDLGNLLQSPWKAYDWKIGGHTYTLDDIEQRILRKRNDPRIHMAIVCASLSCPDLRNEAYRADKLDAQLDDQARRFLSNPAKGLKVMPSGVILSPILKWYAEDFGDEKGVLAFVAHYAVGVPTGATIDDYFTYNWNLNRP